jgi:hypothetical protein
VQGLWRLLGWSLVVNLLMIIFGVTTAPVLLSLAADGAIALLLLRRYMDMRTEIALQRVMVTTRKRRLPPG